MNTTPHEYAQIITITPEIANELLANNNSNRTVADRHVSRLADDIRNGDWRLNGDAIRVTANGNLLDGQHRLLAIIQAGIPVSSVIAFNIAADTQVTMDTGRKRSLADILKMREENDCAALAAAIMQAISWENGSRHFTSNRAASSSAALRWLDTNPDIRTAARKGRTLAGANLGITGSLASVLYWAFSRIDAEDADYFFYKLAQDNGHAEGSPILALRRAMINENDKIKGSTNKRWLASIVCKAWNKYRNGEESLMLTFRAGGAKPENFPEPI